MYKFLSRDAAHRRLLLGGLAAVARGENEIQLARGELCVLVEHLVEVAETEKEDGILILLLDLKILAHHRREVCHVRCSLSKKSDRKGRSGRHVGEAVAQRFVQPGVSVVAGAVAGDVARRLPRAQALAHRVHKGSRLALTERGIVEMEAREHIVRRTAQNVLCAVDDVDDAAVGAASEEDGFAVLRHQQVLLVAEGVAGIVPADLFAQRGVCLAQELVRPDAGEERQLLVELCHTLGHHEAVSILVQLGIETDEGAFRNLPHYSFRIC